MKNSNLSDYVALESLNFSRISIMPLTTAGTQSFRTFKVIQPFCDETENALLVKKLDSLRNSRATRYDDCEGAKSHLKKLMSK